MALRNTTLAAAVAAGTASPGYYAKYLRRVGRRRTADACAGGHAACALVPDGPCSIALHAAGYGRKVALHNLVPAVPCPACGEPFRPTPERRVTCSAACALTYRVAQREAQAAEEVPAEEVPPAPDVLATVDQALAEAAA